MVSRVLLINPNRMKPPVTPIALDYLADALARNGIQPHVLDLCLAGDWRAAMDVFFARTTVDAVGMTLRNIDDTTFASREFFLPGFKEISDYVKLKTDAPTIVGGSGFSIMPEDVLEYCGLDLGVVGDGEGPLPMLVRMLTEGQDYRHVPGLVYRDGAGFSRNAAIWPDIQAAPPPGRLAVDNGRYLAEGGMGSIESKRGCPNRCIYCVDALSKGHRWRCRSPESVVDEMEALLAQGVDCLHFCDSEFNLPASHARDVCREIVRRGLGDRLGWYAYASPVPFDSDTAALYRQAGCRGINFGVDSADDRVLRMLGRDYTAEDLSRTAAACRRQRLTFMYDLLLGGPGETRETLERTVTAMKRMSPDRVGAALGIRLFPGTRLADMILAAGPLDSNPNLHGDVANNGRLFRPVFYLSAELGSEAPHYLDKLVGGDERFLLMRPPQAGDMNYNYNDNSRLVEAIRQGYRGAFWDILRRVSDSGSNP
ncbi:MAG: radical SAM protein [Dehalococcoidia bacterium]|nr:radical SAM protein [Dehalococcoidia bacterium]